MCLCVCPLKWVPISGTCDKRHLQESHTYLIGVPDWVCVCVCGCTHIHMLRRKHTELWMPRALGGQRDRAQTEREGPGTARTGRQPAAPFFTPS